MKDRKTVTEYRTIKRPLRPVVTLFAAVLLFATAFSLPDLAYSQSDNSNQNSAGSDEFRVARKGLGAQVLLLNSGLGVGAYMVRIVSPTVTLRAEISISSIKDGREVAFFNRLGQKEVPDKANYVLQIPIQFGIEHRLFQSVIEDNFRPFIHAVTGPSLIWRSPYFDDLNNNGELDSDEPVLGSFQSLSKGNLEMGWSGTLSIGAHFGKLYGGTQSLRIGYTFTYLFNEIALLEPSVRDPARWVGSPTIRLSFGKLY